MLVKFSLDPDVLLDPDVGLDAMRRHRALLNLWGLIGQLTIPGHKESQSSFLEALKLAPQKVQVIWRQALKNHWKRLGNAEFEKAMNSNVGVRDDQIFDGVRLLMLEPRRSELWGLDDESYSKSITKNLEICRFGHEDCTAVIKGAIDLSIRPIAANEIPDRVWEQRLRELCIVSGVITVVDRYAVKNFLERTSGLSGLERLLKRVSELNVPNKKIVTIYSAYSLDWRLHGSVSTFSAACNQIFDQIENFCYPLCSGGLREVNVYLGPDRRFGNIDHYRYIRFDNQNIMLIDGGLQPLGGSFVSKTCPVSLLQWMSPEAEAYREDEKKLKAIIEHDRRIPCL